MEDFENEVPQEVKLVVTEEMRSYFYDITKWTKFLSIVGFVFSALLILVSLNIRSIVSTNPAAAKQLGTLGNGGTTMLTIVYLLFGLLYFYPSLLLFRISNKGKQAVLYGDQESLNVCILSLKSLFKFWGIVTILGILGFFLLNLILGAGMVKV
ncbi:MULTISPECIES: DUF5362 family protein [unclassified Pedobacter]|uniref:DUF5362 family protein n=1 Tax=unclassified Pedobacter TaxID=2628915 RepID=UPI00141E2112|nr:MULTISPECIES: DUF5362 family protein [unclassified Pedobacter]NII83669.1 hypothetical protein [Pedobacter sp. SG908]NMN37529.1 hypothetical protein [Pedobacter sp. SG918]